MLSVVPLFNASSPNSLAGFLLPILFFKKFIADLEVKTSQTPSQATHNNLSFGFNLYL